MKNRDYKFLVFCLFVLLAASFLLTGCTRDDEDVVIEESEEVVQEEQEEQEEQDWSEEEEKESTVSGDFSKFSENAQEIGNIGNESYVISSFSETSMEGFHRFVFEVEGGQNLPNVVASYRAELGAIRLVFQDIKEDASGLGYQRSFDINKEGVVRIFHNVSPNEDEEVYDIGVAKLAQFYLYSEKLEDGKWGINLDIRYPGESDIEIDLGNQEFGLQEQEIEGATSSDGARITNYSYGIEDNKFQFIWTVRGSDEKPIPKVSARYNDEGELVVVFPDLDSDYIGRDSNEVTLLRNVEKVIWRRTGSETIYRFVLKEKSDYRLKSSLSPNQVILEIEL